MGMNRVPSHRRDGETCVFGELEAETSDRVVIRERGATRGRAGLEIAAVLYQVELRAVELTGVSHEELDFIVCLNHRPSGERGAPCCSGRTSRSLGVKVDRPCMRYLAGVGERHGVATPTVLEHRFRVRHELSCDPRVLRDIPARVSGVK